MAKIDIKFYEGIAKEFVGKLHRLNNFTKHGPSIGKYHEEILKVTLRSFLPERYSLKTGFIFVETGVVSQQVDILVVDESEPTSYFFKEGDFVVVHPDCVVCGIEVKTFLDKATFQKAVENICSLRQMAAYSNYKNSLGGMIFAYNGTELSPQITHDWWKSINNIPEKISLYPTMMLVLNQGEIDLRPGKVEPWGHYFAMGEEKEQYKIKGLSRFLQTVRKYTELKAGKQANPFSYAHFDGQCWTKEYLRFGRGLISTMLGNAT